MSAGTTSEHDTQDSGASRFKDLIEMEFQYLSNQFISNEELGEKRVAFFVTLTAGIGAAALIAQEKTGNADSIPVSLILLGINVVWLLFGYLTFLRILRRNVQTDRLKVQLQNVRKWFVAESNPDRHFLPWDPHGKQPPLRKGLQFFGGTGGYAEMVALTIATTTGTLAWQLVSFMLSDEWKGKIDFWLPHSAAGMLLALLTAWLTWGGLAALVHRATPSGQI
jgi:hypothetical protein